MAIYSRPSKGLPPKQSPNRSEPVVRSWMPLAVSPPTVRTPAFMLGGRFAVIREPHFILDARPGEGTPASRADKAKSAGLSLVDPSDESSHET
jgi:hypothetical protein